jgi:Protein of unknown function (DUF1565)
VTSRFDAAPDGASGTLTVEASTAAEAGERALTVQGTSGSGTSTWVGALKIKTMPSASAKTFFVDPIKGNDATTGAQDKPFKTLAKALSVAKKGDKIILAKGIYSKTTNGEVFPVSGLLVPAGVTIEGTLGGLLQASMLQGERGVKGLNFAGDATVKNLRLTGFEEAVLAHEGKQSLNHLILTNNHIGLRFSGTAQTTLTNSGISLIGLAAGGFIEDQAQFTMDGGRITAGFSGCDFSEGLLIEC